MGRVTRSWEWMLFAPTCSVLGLVPAALSQTERNLHGMFLSPVVLCPFLGTAQPSILWSVWTRQKNREYTVLQPH